MRARIIGLVVTVYLSALAASCSSEFSVLPQSAPFDISGRYHSTEQLANLGRLTMEIEKNTETVFQAWIIGSMNPDALSTGVGTVGDNHFILNFDRGLDSDFYVEGTFTSNGDVVDFISAEFIFPDRQDYLEVDFERIEQ